MLFFVSALLASSLQEALDEAATKELAKSRYWLTLLHMPSASEGSEIDDPAFFLSPEGKEDPEAELNATIRALFTDARVDDNATACRYPARLRWLSERLRIADAIPKAECREFDDFMKKVDPRAVTLVFSAAHINSPASMFGHTFLRIDSSFKSKVLSHAINYAAAADPSKENGVVFAIKGLFGGYEGRYSLLPYYDKLKEYRDTEQRNMWEYELNLTPAETAVMVRHIWELKSSYNLYYFFDENCSYNMLWLLEAARPTVRLRRHFAYQVIPLETVYAVETEGLVASRKFRPSKRAVLLAYEERLDDEGISVVKALAEGKLDPSELLSRPGEKQKKRHILEAASELVQYRLIEGELEKPLYVERYHAILRSRAALGKGEKVHVVPPQNPDRGHRAVRVMFATGWREGSAVQWFGIRPAYHDLTDSNVGFLEGTQIEFLDLTGRYDRSGFALERATILSIVSIAPLSSLFRPLSWRTSIGWDREYRDRGSALRFGVGAGAAVGGRRGYLYGMVDPEIFADRGGTGALSVSLGGVRRLPGGSKLFGEIRRRFYFGRGAQWTGRGSFTLRLSQNSAVGVEYSYVAKHTAPERSAMLFFRYYL